MAQQFTQYAGVRPFGVALILAGVDKNGTALYLTDPSGTYIGYDAVAIGAGAIKSLNSWKKVISPTLALMQAALLPSSPYIWLVRKRQALGT